MISKQKVRVAIVLSVFMGLVFSPVFAERYRTTEEIEMPAEKDSLIDSAYNRVAGTTYIAGKAITETANSAGEALVGTAKAGGETLGGAADASGKSLGGAADAVTGTAGSAYRKVGGSQEPSEEPMLEDVRIEEVQIEEVQIEEVEIEAVAIEQPKEKNLFEASWDALTGTADAIGGTFEAAYISVFPVEEAEDEPEPEPEEPEVRTHHFAPRYHGMVARRIQNRQR